MLFFAVGMLKWQHFIHHFHIDHDSLCYNHCLRCLFGRLLYPREIGLWLFKIWGEEEGVVEVYYGRCENGKLFWIANHSLTFFRFFSPCIKTANQETRNNHEDAFGRPWNSNLDLTGIYAQLFSLRRKTRKYTPLRIIFRLKKNAALASSTDKLSDKPYSKCERQKLGVLSLHYDIYWVANHKVGRGCC